MSEVALKMYMHTFVQVCTLHVGKEMDIIIASYPQLSWTQGFKPHPT